jgi:hypothetical protein
MFARLILPAFLLSLTSQAFAVVGDYVPDADSIRQRYRALYDLQPEVQPDGSVRFHNGRLFKRGGLNVLYVHGDSFEMAYQHARLLRDEVRDGVVPEAARIVYNQINNAYYRTPIIRNQIYNYIDRNFTTEMLDRALDRVSPEVRERALRSVFALSEGSGVPVNTFLDASLNPSVLMLLAARTTDGVTPDDNLPEGLPGLGAAGAAANCSEFAVWGERTEDGHVVIGRNTDYPLTGVYDDNHTVIYFDPTNPGSQPYMSVISAGAHNAGVLAFNQSGIYVGSHTIPSRAVATDAVPAFFIAQDVMARAKTFDEALEIFRSYRAESGWTYVVMSVNEGRLASVEINADGVAVRPATGDYHVQTNHFITDEMAPKNMHINQSIADDSRGRYARLEALISAHQGPVSLADAARFMADQTDPFGGLVTGLGNTVSVMTTVTSIVARPADGKLYVASGAAPAPHSTYVELPLPWTFDPESFAGESFDSIDNGMFATSHPVTLAAIRKYIDAKEAYEYRNDAAAAKALLSEVVAMDATNARYRLLLALMQLRTDAFTAARTTLEQLIASGTNDAHAISVARYLRGRILADAGNESGAAAEFRAVKNDASADAKLRASAEHALSELDRLFRYRLEPHKLSVMFQFGDLQNYH